MTQALPPLARACVLLAAAAVFLISCGRRPGPLLSVVRTDDGARCVVEVSGSCRVWLVQGRPRMGVDAIEPRAVDLRAMPVEGWPWVLLESVVPAEGRHALTLDPRKLGNGHDLVALQVLVSSGEEPETASEGWIVDPTGVEAPRRWGEDSLARSLPGLGAWCLGIIIVVGLFLLVRWPSARIATAAGGTTLVAALVFLLVTRGTAVLDPDAMSVVLGCRVPPLVPDAVQVRRASEVILATQTLEGVAEAVATHRRREEAVTLLIPASDGQDFLRALHLRRIVAGARLAVAANGLPPAGLVVALGVESPGEVLRRWPGVVVTRWQP